MSDVAIVPFHTHPAQLEHVFLAKHKCAKGSAKPEIADWWCYGAWFQLGPTPAEQHCPSSAKIPAYM